jgi:O-succinylbenzoic acid--CoA ligase
VTLAWPWLARRAERTPDATALVVDGVMLRFAELAARADAMAAAIAAEGVAPGTRVAALLENELPLVTAFHAVDRLGAVWLPLNTRHTPAELGFVLNDAEAGLLLFDTANRELAESAAAARPGLRTHRVDTLDATSGAHAPPVATPDPDAPLAILYTSGTTGRPKGAALSRANFAASAQASSKHLDSGPADSWLACMPLFHVGGLSILVRSVVDGACVVLLPRFEAAAVSKALDMYEPRFVSFTATMLQRVLDVRGDCPAPEGLRCVLLGGGPAPTPLVAHARRQGFFVRKTYGLTEACSQVATQRADAAPGDGVMPLPGVELKILDDSGTPVAARGEGEICVRGPNVMRGYVNAPAATRETLREGWLRTGDIGFLDEGGALHMLDRRNDLIVSGGENVYPAEIEAVLLEHPAVSEVGVAGIDDPEFGRRPVAWWIAAEGSAVSDSALARHCRARLAGYKVPVAFPRCETLPRDVNGKLLRRELPRQLPDTPTPDP